MAKAKKLGLKERYSLLTRGLDWETSYQPMDEVFPYDTYEGIKILPETDFPLGSNAIDTEDTVDRLIAAGADAVIVGNAA